jgi:hypothetical protein
MLRRVLLLSALGALVALGPRAARADDGDAAALFDQAVKLLLPPKDPKTKKTPVPTRADIDNACDLAQKSVDLGATLGSVNLLAICRSQQERHASALAAYKRVVLMSPKSKDEAQKITRAQENIAKLEPVVSTVRVTVTMRVDGLVVTIGDASYGAAHWGTPVPSDGGTWLVRAGAPGHEPWEGTVTVGVINDHQEVVIPALRSNEPVPLPAHPSPVVETPSPPPVDDAVDAPDAIPAEHPSPGMSNRRKAAIGVGAAGVVALGTALVFEMSARSAYDDYLATPTPDPALLDAADSKRYTAIGLGVVGGLCVGGAAVLWIRGADHASDDDGIAIMPASVGSGHGVTLRGHF